MKQHYLITFDDQVDVAVDLVERELRKLFQRDDIHVVDLGTVDDS